MNDIIRMAREAGAWSQQFKNRDVDYVMSAESLERFAALAFAAGVAAERERRAFELAECYRCGWDGGAAAEASMQRLTDVQQEMVGPSIKETRHHRANRMLKEAMDSDRENIIRNMPDFDFDFHTESKKQKPLTEEEIDRVWRSVDYKISYDNFRLAIARAIERAHGIGGEE
jgi:oligoendopeptidase F